MNKENINNFIKYRANNSTIQKSVSCNKLTPSKCQQVIAKYQKIKKNTFLKQ